MCDVRSRPQPNETKRNHEGSRRLETAAQSRVRCMRMRIQQPPQPTTFETLCLDESRREDDSENGGKGEDDAARGGCHLI